MAQATSAAVCEQCKQHLDQLTPIIRDVLGFGQPGPGGHDDLVLALEALDEFNHAAHAFLKGAKGLGQSLRCTAEAAEGRDRKCLKAAARTLRRHCRWLRETRERTGSIRVLWAFREAALEPVNLQIS